MALVDLSATEQLARIHAGQLSPVALMEATLCRIAQVNPELNAIVTLADDLLAKAERATGPLRGLPVGIKDVTATAGLRTTYGSALFADHVPDASADVVTRLEAAGAIVVGKTNTPEFATGGHTDNAVFGATRNPWDLDRTAGGSTGGGAAALASGMIALAEGTDMGGSLRIPAAFCNVCGLRPRPGLVPEYDDLQVTGPMARTVEDLLLVWSALHRPVDPPPPPYRLAMCEDLSGRGIDPAATVDLDLPRIQLDLSDGCEAFEALRGAWMVKTHRHLLDRLGQLGPALAGNIRLGLAVTEARLAAAEAIRRDLTHRVLAVLDRFDALVTPAVAIPPFRIADGVPTHIGDTQMRSYIDWVAPTYLLTLTALPVVAVPIRPGVGVQVVAKDEATALAAAASLARPATPPLPEPPLETWLQRLPDDVFERVAALPYHLKTHGPVPREVRIAELMAYTRGLPDGEARLRQRLGP